MTPRRFRDIVDSLDHIYKLRDASFTVDNSAVLNKILYGAVKLLASKGPNAVSTLEAVIRASEIGHISVSALLWQLPQLLPADKAQALDQITGHMQGLITADSVNMPLFHEKQRGLLCLLHALNNLLECRVFTNHASPDRVVNGMINLNAVDGASGTGATGDYLDQAIPRACEAIGLSALLLPASHSWALHAVHQTYGGTLGAIALRRNHYVAIVCGEHLMLVDSLRTEPRRFASIEAMESYMARCSIVWVILAPEGIALDHCGPRLEALAKEGYRGTMDAAAMLIKRLWDTTHTILA